jgi:hypothetical protein
MPRFFFLILSLWLCTIPVLSSATECGRIERVQDGIHEGNQYPTTYTYTTDKGRAVIVRQDMRVNADGARRAYELDNHGISYLCDGLTVGHGAGWITRKPCGSTATKAIEDAEQKDGWLYFSDRKPSMCIFGFYVKGGKKGVSGCSGSVVGGGQPAAKAQLISVPAPGGPLQYFISTTSLRNTTNDKTKEWIDSEQIPFIVIPDKWPHAKIVLGDYAYVYSPRALGIERETLTGPRGSFAIVADTGPRGKFGEGSIALHQMLVFGELRPAPEYQWVAKGKPHPEHASIYHPYRDRGDGDIRAKSNIDEELWYILFSNSANKEVKEHSFQVGNDGAPGGNVYAEGTSAAEMLGGHDHIISCLKESPHFD